MNLRSLYKTRRVKSRGRTLHVQSLVEVEVEVVDSVGRRKSTRVSPVWFHSLGPKPHPSPPHFSPVREGTFRITTPFGSSLRVSFWLTSVTFVES